MDMSHSHQTSHRIILASVFEYCLSKLLWGLQNDDCLKNIYYALAGISLSHSGQS